MLENWYLKPWTTSSCWPWYGQWGWTRWCPEISANLSCSVIPWDRSRRSITWSMYPNCGPCNPEGYARRQLLYTMTRIPLPTERVLNLCQGIPWCRESGLSKYNPGFNYSANNFEWNSSKTKPDQIKPHSKLLLLNFS